jgi:hypothetical protein
MLDSSPKLLLADPPQERTFKRYNLIVDEKVSSGSLLSHKALNPNIIKASTGDKYHYLKCSMRGGCSNSPPCEWTDALFAGRYPMSVHTKMSVDHSAEMRCEVTN